MDSQRTTRCSSPAWWGRRAANGGWTITNVDADHFTLNGTNNTSTNSYTSGGVVYSFTAIPKSSNGIAIPPGAGITGHILIQIVDANGVARDVTTQILSMGMTEGEPNAIIHLQRPLWAAFTQGSRDASGLSNSAVNGDPAYTNCLTDILSKTRKGADGEIKIDPPTAFRPRTAPMAISLRSWTTLQTEPSPCVLICREVKRSVRPA